LQDLESLISDSNRSIATLAITTLLKTGSEFSVDRLMKQAIPLDLRHDAVIRRDGTGQQHAPIQHWATMRRHPAPRNSVQRRNTVRHVAAAGATLEQNAVRHPAQRHTGAEKASSPASSELLTEQPVQRLRTHAHARTPAANAQASARSRAMGQISSFMADIADEFKIVVVDAIRSLCLKCVRACVRARCDTTALRHALIAETGFVELSAMEQPEHPAGVGTPRSTDYLCLSSATFFVRKARERAHAHAHPHTR
jgi:hypothetical protein